MGKEGEVEWEEKRAKGTSTDDKRGEEGMGREDNAPACMHALLLLHLA